MVRRTRTHPTSPTATRNHSFARRVAPFAPLALALAMQPGVTKTTAGAEATPTGGLQSVQCEDVQDSEQCHAKYRSGCNSSSQPYDPYLNFVKNTIDFSGAAQPTTFFTKLEEFQAKEQQLQAEPERVGCRFPYLHWLRLHARRPDHYPPRQRQTLRQRQEHRGGDDASLPGSLPAQLDFRCSQVSPRPKGQSGRTAHGRQRSQQYERQLWSGRRRADLLACHHLGIAPSDQVSGMHGCRQRLRCEFVGLG